MSSSASSSSNHPADVGRRSFVQASVAMGSPWLLPSALAAGGRIEAYANVASVKPGASLTFHARDPQSGWLGQAQPLTVTRMGWPDKAMHKTTVLLFNRLVPLDASTKGCRWPSSYRLSIPSTWPSGVYWATLGTGANACSVPFIVRSAKPATGTKVLVQIPVTTAQAYNNYGGKSLYEYNSSNGKRASQVSFDRPFSEQYNIGFDGWTPALVRWLESKGIVADYCSSIDLHAEATLLTGYQLFITAGHDEYWSLPMRKNLDAFVAAGGNAAIFAGNTCWWQVRFDSSNGANRTMVCHKSAITDLSMTAATKTVTWQELSPRNPENTTTGLSFLKGASWTNAFPRPSTPFVVQAPGHWAFAGLNLAQNASFGGAYVGYETDAADFRQGADGLAYPTGLDGSPATLRILAQADASTWDAQAQALGLSGERSGYAAIAIFSRGGKQGTVFNAGTTDWVYGLQPELNGQTPTPISTITLNVIRKLSTTWSETAEVRRFKSTPPSGPASYYYTIGTETPADMVLEGGVFAALAAPAAGTTPIYRFHAPDSGSANGRRYHYSTSQTYLPSLGWVAEGIAFHAYATDGPGRRAVYQFRTQDVDGNTVLFFSTDIDGAPGWTADSPAFFVPAAGIP